MGVALVIEFDHSISARDWFLAARHAGLINADVGLAKADGLDVARGTRLPAGSLVLSSDPGRRYVVEPIRAAS